MDALDLTLLEPFVLTVGLVSVRLLGLFLALPLLAFRSFPLALRVAPVLALTLGMVPPDWVDSAQLAQQGGLAVATELGIGVVAGLSLRLAMLAVDYLAESLSMHAGFSFAQTVAPDSALPSTVIGELLGMSVLASLFLADVHLLFIERLAFSFVSVPFGSWPSAWDAAAVLELMATAFSIGLVMSCGSFALYLFANFTLGMINRISPQLNLMSVGFSVTAPLALVVIALVTLQLPVLSEIIAAAALKFVDQGFLYAR
ncbi:MAG: flagellar biosynthetic protein FliR [Hydrogenophaga sp.]|uniref:flagellar biosynthetic protein FliR n=1 Tax=Hydrogenophaga sp. TaxID=1904254 RepID=UPI00262E6CC5|nr:flagellar biosynthetic protein FliR [Hydrogenophaga sp.]MDM7942419.1 flagellar biosynthetic protein FliR [Hydrogenophaga sp.]